MTNFDYLKSEKEFESFVNIAITAEKVFNIDIGTCVFNCRRALEMAIKWMYSVDNDLEVPYQDSLYSLMHTDEFRDIIGVDLWRRLDLIRRYGNDAAHTSNKISENAAKLCLKNLFYFTDFIACCYGKSYQAKEYDESLLTNQESKNIEIEEKEIKLNDLIEENKALKQELTLRREQQHRDYVPKPLDLSEYKTRKIYIDSMLIDAGWVEGKDWINEVEMPGMPNKSEVGYADYVLYDDSHKPLAIIEAKRTCVNVSKGRQQAELYADLLEKKYKRRPVIFLTNGFEIKINDGQYPERKVSSIYSKRDLEKLFNLRRMKSHLNYIQVNKEIAGRYYQEAAIKAVCEAFDKRNRRKALLVMATGSGKTRTVIGLVDILLQNGWIKNILFLADRNSLVTQAKRSFNNMLKDLSNTNLVEEKDNYNAHAVFSTYQTMMGCIDSIKDEGKKLFTCGHFDLIICDEAHRSIYNKYRDVFNYFDAPMIGLTATPKDEIDKNTYDVFELENGVPTYGYELSQAVKDGYLVDFLSLETQVKFMEEGINWDELSDEDKRIYEDTFTDENGNFPKKIDSSALNKWVFNNDTIKKVLQILFKDGLKIDYGQKIGKTIIFAKNHRHAQKIEDVFNELYPSYKGEFAKLIDNQVKYNDTIIDDFSKKDDFPQIAISVDMLDTGVDVPEVVNLVFFKPVKSKIKFWQMIGRGTRLCKDLFGIGQDKKEFYIFDYCKNFEFFSVNAKGIETSSQISLTEKIFNYKLDLIVELQHMKYQSQEDFKQYRESLINEFIEEISKLNKDSFMVKAKLYYIDQFSKKENWNYLSILDATNIKENITPILFASDENEDAKKFDNLLYSLQVKRINNQKTKRIEENISSLVTELEKLGTVPKVVEKQELIIKVAETDYLSRASFFEIERVREELRNLIQYIDPYMRPPVYSDFEDTLMEVSEEYVYLSSGNDFTNYKKKISKYFNSNLDNIIVWKIRHNEKINEIEKKDLERILFEELGTNKEFENAYGDKNVVEVVRNIVGLDPATASEIFSKYINQNQLNMRQIQFVKLLIDYVIKNGTIDMIALTEDPFRAVGEVGELFEDKYSTFMEIRKDIENINENAKELA